MTVITEDVWQVQWASYQIRKIAGCACAGNAGNVSPRRRFQRKLLVSDPGMHHGTCVTHVPWCMSVSLTCGDGENVPGIPGACAPAILRIWQEAHALKMYGTEDVWQVQCRSNDAEPATFLVHNLLCFVVFSYQLILHSGYRSGLFLWNSGRMVNES